MTPSSADASSLRSRLDELRTLDPGPAPRIFGASHHGYTSHPTAPEELAALERRLGVRLPADYRAFLLERSEERRVGKEGRSRGMPDH